MAEQSPDVAHPFVAACSEHGQSESVLDSRDSSHELGSRHRRVNDNNHLRRLQSNENTSSAQERRLHL